MATLNLLDFGAMGDARAANAAANDAAFARAVNALATTGGSLHIPHGVYAVSRPVVVKQRRNILLTGDGGNSGHPGTRLVYIGDDPAGCLHLSTCIHGRFEFLCFEVDAPAPDAIVRIDAVEAGPEAISSLNNHFEGCTFRAGPRAQPDLRGVSLKDAGHSEFRHCWFQTPRIAVRIGAPMRKPRPTISNGQCSNTAFDNCLFFADVIGERGTNVTFQNCEFATRPNGDGAKIDFGIGDNPHVCNVSVRDCFAINGQTHRGTFFKQGRGGAGFVMTNSRIRGYAVAVDLDGAGAAMLAANVFEQTSPGAVDIKVRCVPDAVSLIANQHQRTIEAGNEPVMPAARES